MPFSLVVQPYLRLLVPWEDDITGAHRPKHLDPELELVEIDPRYNGGHVSFAHNRVPLFGVAGALLAGDDPQDVAEDFD